MPEQTSEKRCGTCVHVGPEMDGVEGYEAPDGREILGPCGFALCEWEWPEGLIVPDWAFLGVECSRIVELDTITACPVWSPGSDEDGSSRVQKPSEAPERAEEAQ